jgi:peptidoglycan/xylan/chitin deacetylase (PgdA/CDA1 family)
MLLRWLICQALMGFLLTMSSLAADHASVFLYHRFAEPQHPSTNIAPEDFRRHLQILQEGGYHVIPLGELISLLSSHQPLPERTVALSVDDVYRSFLDEALPLLREYGYPATLFISTSTVGGGDFLTWSEIADLAAAGFEIGSHSASHDFLLDRLDGETPTAWLKRVERDLLTAQKAFADHLGFEPELFAYPYGEYDPQLLELVRRLGFRAAFGQQSGVVAADQDRYALPRFPMVGSSAAPAEFAAKLKMRPLSVEVLEPKTTRLDPDRNPPVLKIRIDLTGLEASSLRCYVNGVPVDGPVVADAEHGVYEVRAEQRLEGRRNKYTLTASDRSGQQWFWFSQIWVCPRPWPLDR